MKTESIAPRLAPEENGMSLQVVSDPAPAQGGFTSLDHAAILSCLGDLVFQVNRQGEVLDVHCPVDNEFQIDPKEWVGENLRDLLPATLLDRAQDWLQTALSSGKPGIYEIEYPLGGRSRFFQIRTAPCDGNRVMAVVRDATARQHFEREILEVSQRTQHRIGQDLHDGLGQHLTGITFLSKALERKLAARNLPEAADAADIVRMVINVLSQTRQLARSLFPMELESGELVEALREMAVTVETTARIACRVVASEGLTVGNPDVVNHLFRLTQEAVNNAVKHGNPGCIEIRLTLEGEMLRLNIHDDGDGFDTHQRGRQGLGMRIMQYRAQKIGMQLEFKSSPTAGTEVICSLRHDGAAAEAGDSNHRS